MVTNWCQGVSEFGAFWHYLPSSGRRMWFHQNLTEWVHPLCTGCSYCSVVKYITVLVHVQFNKPYVPLADAMQADVIPPRSQKLIKLWHKDSVCTVLIIFLEVTENKRVWLCVSDA